MENAIADAINTYHELNTSSVDELEEEPSPLEFMRFIARNRPFIVRDAAGEWDAVNRWNSSYLRKVMCDESVNVAITPLG